MTLHRINPRNFQKKILTFVFLLWSFALSAEEDQKIYPDLKIQFKFSASTDPKLEFKSSKTTRKSLIKACTNMAKALSIGQGPWGIGLFKEISCFLENEKLFGTDSEDSWTLVIDQANDQLNVKSRVLLIEDTANDASRRIEKEFSAKTEIHKLLQNQAFADLVAIRLLNELPYMGVVRKTDINAKLESSRRHIHQAIAAESVKPPASLLAFSSSTYGKWVMPSVLGRVVCKNSSKTNDKSQIGETHDSENEVEQSAQRVTWKYEKKLLAADWDQAVWFHDERGFGKYSQEVDAALAAYEEKFYSDQHQDLWSSSRVQIQDLYKSMSWDLKIGFQAFTNDELVKNRKQLMLSGSIDAGDWRHWKYIYEKNPKMTTSGNTLNESLEYSNHLIARKIAFGEFLFLNQVEFFPQVGVSALKAEVFDSFNDQNEGDHLNKVSISRGYQLGIQANFILKAKKFVFSPVVEYQYVNGFDANNAAYFTNLKYGIDAYYQSTNKFLRWSENSGYRVGTFFVLEKINIIDAGGSSSESTASASVTSWTFNSGMAGLRCGVFW